MNHSTRLNNARARNRSLAVYSILSYCEFSGRKSSGLLRSDFGWNLLFCMFQQINSKNKFHRIISHWIIAILSSHWFCQFILWEIRQLSICGQNWQNFKMMDRLLFKYHPIFGRWSRVVDFSLNDFAWLWLDGAYFWCPFFNCDCALRKNRKYIFI